MAVSGLAVALLLTTAVSGFADEDEPRFTRTVAAIEVPDVTLVDEYGDLIELRERVLGDKPVYVEFVFATCTTICPIMSAGFSSMQRKLAPETEQVVLLSITIDPEHDNPEMLMKYLKRYRAQPGWSFLTGSRDDIDQVMRAFGAYVADKMSHRPLTFFREPADGSWVRLAGFPGTADLMAELSRPVKQ